MNIANGRFLWRNRVGAEKAEVIVSIKGENKKWIFNIYDFSLKDFDKNREKWKNWHLLLPKLSVERGHPF